MKISKDIRAQKHSLRFRLNGKEVNCEVKSSALLLDILRDLFELKGTKSGCNEGECGACTVLINGSPVNSCLYLAVNAHGKEIITIEGLIKEDGSLDRVQESLVQNGAVQCGFCTSGMAMSIKGLLNKIENDQLNKDEITEGFISRVEIKKWLEGNLCRCTGYIKIIDAAQEVMKEIKR